MSFLRLLAFGRGRVNKKQILLGSLLGAAVLYSSVAQTSDEVKHAEHISKEKTRKVKHKRHHNEKKLVQIINKLNKIDDELNFEEKPQEYFKILSYKAKQIARMYGHHAPTEEHVLAIKLYAVMYEAFANATKDKAEINWDLLKDAHSKKADLIRIAEKLTDSRTNGEKNNPKHDE